MKTFLSIQIPENRIAKFPRGKGKSLLMVVRRNPFSIEHRKFYEIVDILTPEYMLILNNTKVLKARLPLRKPSGRFVDLLFVGFDERGFIRGMLKGRVKDGWILKTPKGAEFLVMGRDSEGYVLLEFKGNIFEVLEEEGRMPLPPYIKRDVLPEDEEYYQTVYAEKPGSIAAPTAGLHFTEEILK
ncbi:MAG: S-adenosylmethionine:tRNA ribosyltransferase-isomerase, partial [candidate division WOR-3 bacterium]